MFIEERNPINNTYFRAMSTQKFIFSHFLKKTYFQLCEDPGKVKREIIVIVQAASLRISLDLR